MGFLALIAADLTPASGPGLTVAMIGIGLWGLHMGLTQGLLASLMQSPKQLYPSISVG